MMEKILTQFGFRIDPMKWVENDQSLRGAVVRKQVFNKGSPDDRKTIEALIKEILSKRGMLNSTLVFLLIGSRETKIKSLANNIFLASEKFIASKRPVSSFPALVLAI